MTDDVAQNLIDALDDLLDAERAALLAGDLEKIARLLPRKEDILVRLAEQVGTDSAVYEPLRAKVRRNQMLLDGALEGIRSVAKRMAGQRKARGSLDTYDSAGRKRSVPSPGRPSIERRA